METSASTASSEQLRNSPTQVTSQPAMGATSPNGIPPLMRLRKRDGRLEPANVLKTVERVTRLCGGLNEVHPHRVAIRAISGLYDGATTKELDDLCVQTASLL